MELSEHDLVGKNKLGADDLGVVLQSSLDCTDTKGPIAGGVCHSTDGGTHWECL